jgi:PKD repeat protein
MTSGYRVIGLLIIGTMASGGCRLSQTSEPALAGPSMFGITVGLAATPDLLPRDGRTTARILASVRDGANAPVGSLTLHFDVRIDGRPGALGTLSASDVTTASDGTATVYYTPPMPAPLVDSQDATIQIVVTPVGSNASNQTSSMTTIRLAELGGPTATFRVAPDPPLALEIAVFDASTSAGSPGQSITTYAWDYGDGNAAFVISEGPQTTHEYDRGGLFTVRLRVIDSAGKSSTVSRQLLVAQ